MSKIGIAKQNYDTVEVYDENGKMLFGKSGKLVGYTATTVSIETRSGMLEVYDENGKIKFSKCL